MERDAQDSAENDLHENIDNVGDLMLSQDNNLHTTHTQREISHELGISTASVIRNCSKRSAAAVLQEMQSIRVNCSEQASTTATCKEIVEAVSSWPRQLSSFSQMRKSSLWLDFQTTKMAESMLLPVRRKNISQPAASCACVTFHRFLL